MGKGMDIKLKADISELEKSLKKLNTAARLSTNLTNGKGYEFKAQKIEVLKQKLESAKLKLKELKELEEKWAAAR